MALAQKKQIIDHGVSHIAVIMDGNRRWAKQRNLPGIEGHRKGVEALKNLVSILPDYKVEYLTVYAFSTENWRRDESSCACRKKQFDRGHANLQLVKGNEINSAVVFTIGITL